MRAALQEVKILVPLDDGRINAGGSRTVASTTVSSTTPMEVDEKSSTRELEVSCNSLICNMMTIFENSNSKKFSK